MSYCSKDPVLRTHHLPCLRTIHLLEELHVKISAKQKNSLPVLTGQQVSASVGKLFAHFAEDLEKLTEAGMVKMLLLVKLMARLHVKEVEWKCDFKSQMCHEKFTDIGWHCLFQLFFEIRVADYNVLMYCMHGFMDVYVFKLRGNTQNPGNLAIEAAPMEQVLPRQFVGTQRWFWCYQKRFDHISLQVIIEW